MSCRRLTTFKTALETIKYHTLLHLSSKKYEYWYFKLDNKDVRVSSRIAQLLVYNGLITRSCGYNGVKAYKITKAGLNYLEGLVDD